MRLHVLVLLLNCLKSLLELAEVAVVLLKQLILKLLKHGFVA